MWGKFRTPLTGQVGDLPYCERRGQVSDLSRDCFSTIFSLSF
jgi:hypothetical protein